HIVHFPVLALEPGGFGGASTGHGVLVNANQREVAELESYLLVKLLNDLLNNRVVLAAKRALIVAPFLKRHAALALAGNMMRQRAGFTTRARLAAVGLIAG